MFRPLLLFGSTAVQTCPVLLRSGPVHFLQAGSFLLPRRMMFERREINKHMENKFKMEDGIPQDYRIIYRAPLHNYMKFSYSVCFVSGIGVPSVITLALSVGNRPEFPITFLGMEVASNYYELGAFILGFTVILTQLGLTIFRYPLRMYLDSDRGHYIVIYQDFLPWKHKKEEFFAGEMKKCKKGIMPWKDSLYKFRNRKAIFMEDHFRRPIDFTNMFHPISDLKDD